MRYTTEYQPALSQECLTHIGLHIEPSMYNYETSVYALDYLYETLTERLGDEEELFGITSNDMAVLKQLIDEKVDYIEF
jgi:hypothetical protein